MNQNTLIKTFQGRTISQPAIKIPFSPSSFAINLFCCCCYYYFASATDVPLKQDAVMRVSVPAGLTIKFKTMLGILQTSVENGLFIYLFCIFSTYIVCCVRDGPCQNDTGVECVRLP